MLVPLFDVDRAFAEVDSLRRQMDTFFGTQGLDGRHGLRTLRPTLRRWTEEEAGYSLTLDVPGLQADNVKVSVENNQLTLHLSRSTEGPEGTTARHRERRAFDWKRTLTLPEHVDVQGIEANLEHGVLTLRAPKAATAQSRTIPVQS